MKFAISDIHGCHQTFLSLLEEISFSKEDQLFLLGDFIDRGPSSKQVINHIWQLQKEGYSIQCLRGNHEQMLLDGVNDPVNEVFWLKNGGAETINSFNVQNIQKIPTKYIQWMKDLPCYLETEGYLMVHAGLNFNKAEPLLDEEGLMWSRRWYSNLNREWLGNRIIIHGHTPTERETLRGQLKNLSELPVINIDNGCYMPSETKGNLMAFNLDKKEMTFLKNQDR